MRVFTVTGFPILLAMMCTGCEATHLIYVTDVSVGVDVSVSAQGVSNLVFGFDRDILAIVPRLEDGSEAMTLVSFSNISAKGIEEMKFHSVVATGKAAMSVSKNKAVLESLRKTILEEEE